MPDSASDPASAIVLINVTLNFIDYQSPVQRPTIGGMKKRAMVMRRAALRKTLFVLLVVAVLAVESLTMTQVYRGFSTAPVRQQMTIDPGLVFQGW